MHYINAYITYCCLLHTNSSYFVLLNQIWKFAVPYFENLVGTFTSVKLIA